MIVPNLATKTCAVSWYGEFDLYIFFEDQSEGAEELNNLWVDNLRVHMSVW